MNLPLISVLVYTPKLFLANKIDGFAFVTINNRTGFSYPVWSIWYCILTQQGRLNKENQATKFKCSYFPYIDDQTTAIIFMYIQTTTVTISRNLFVLVGFYGPVTQYWSYRAGVYLCDMYGVWMPSFGGLLPPTLSGSRRILSSPRLHRAII